MKYMYLYIFMIIISCQENGKLNKKNDQEFKKTQSKNAFSYLEEKSNGFDMKDQLSLSTKDKVFELCSILDKENKIFYYHSDINCTPCVEEEIQKIEKYNIKNKNKIIVLSNYHVIRDLYVFMKVNKITKTLFFRIKNEKTRLPIREINVPFYFRIDKDCKVLKVTTSDNLNFDIF